MNIATYCHTDYETWIYTYEINRLVNWWIVTDSKIIANIKIIKIKFRNYLNMIPYNGSRNQPLQTPYVFFLKMQRHLPTVSYVGYI